MCIGVPMRLLEAGTFEALAESDTGERRCIQLTLVGEQPEGAYVLVLSDQAMRVLDPLEARQISDGLAAVLAAERGESFDHLFADLVDREPQLPPHLRPAGEPNTVGAEGEADGPRR